MSSTADDPAVTAARNADVSTRRFSAKKRAVVLRARPDGSSGTSAPRVSPAAPSTSPNNLRYGVAPANASVCRPSASALARCSVAASRSVTASSRRSAVAAEFRLVGGFRSTGQIAQFTDHRPHALSPGLGQLAEDQIDRLDTVGTFIDRRDTCIPADSGRAPVSSTYPIPP